jgi:lipoyl(octanoyl) transferase
MVNRNTVLNCRRLGTIDYLSGLNLQEKLHASRRDEQIGDTALFLEHSHVITLGRRGNQDDILVSVAELQRQGVEVFHSTRGGQVTYHGPGQLVVYLIFHLYEAQRELRQFVENLEQALIDCLLGSFGLQAHIDPQHPGVWVGDKKIAALGISVKNRVTMHGMALNVNTDLDKFRNIIPCGISDKGVTSIAELLGQPVDMQTVIVDLAACLVKRYGFTGTTWVEAGQL